MKTPEQMAEEYANWLTDKAKTIRDVADSECSALQVGFLAGYQAAKDQFADAGKVMTSLDKPDAWVRQFCVFCNDWHDGNCPPNRGRNFVKWNTNSPRSAKWISVKERLPEFDVWCVWWSFDQRCENGIGRREVGDSLDWWSDYDYWCELPKIPEAPKGEG